MTHTLLRIVPISILLQMDRVILFKMYGDITASNLNTYQLQEYITLSLKDSEVTDISGYYHFHKDEGQKLDGLVDAALILKDSERLGVIKLDSPFNPIESSDLEIKLHYTIQEVKSDVILISDISEYPTQSHVTRILSGRSSQIVADELVRNYIRSTTSDYTNEGPSLASGVMEYDSRRVDYLYYINKVLDTFKYIKSHNNQVYSLHVVDIKWHHNSDPEIIWYYRDINYTIHWMVNSQPTCYCHGINGVYSYLSNTHYPDLFNIFYANSEYLIATKDSEYHIIHLKSGDRYTLNMNSYRLITINGNIVLLDSEGNTSDLIAQSMIDQYPAYLLNKFHLISASRTALIVTDKWSVESGVIKYGNVYLLKGTARIPLLSIPQYLDPRQKSESGYKFYLESGVLQLDSKNVYLTYGGDTKVDLMKGHPFYQDYLHENLGNYQFIPVGDKLILLNDYECIYY